MSKLSEIYMMISKMSHSCYSKMMGFLLAALLTGALYKDVLCLKRIGAVIMVLLNVLTKFAIFSLIFGAVDK